MKRMSDLKKYLFHFATIRTFEAVIMMLNLDLKTWEKAVFKLVPSKCKLIIEIAFFAKLSKFDVEVDL